MSGLFLSIFSSSPVSGLVLLASISIPLPLRYLEYLSQSIPLVKILPVVLFMSVKSTPFTLKSTATFLNSGDGGFSSNTIKNEEAPPLL